MEDSKRFQNALCQDKADNFPWSLLEVSKMFWYVAVSEVGL